MELKLPERYELAPDPRLGEGGTGQVLLARDAVLNLPVALKVVRPDLAADDRFRRLFQLEVRISARFTHPRIVPLHDHGETEDGTPFLGLAYADRGSFAAFRDAPPPWHELRRLVLQLLDALAHLHARDVLHRDLKPENVLLHDEDGRPSVWLADLGLASVASAMVRDRGRTEGTPGYMAPEQALGQVREYGPWTDLFGVGVLLWEITTGRRPFADDESPHSTPLKAFEPRVAVPRGLETVLANLLSPEPLARYDLAADLRAELQRLTEVNREPGPGRRAPRVGTVAPSLPPPFPDDDVTEDLPNTFVSYAFDGECLDEIRDAPTWNRPLPPGLPDAPPPGSGLGATARASLRLFALREAPMVARDDVRAALWAQARAVADEGRGRIVILVGEAGSGRTRVIEDLVHTLEEGGWAESVWLSHEREGSDRDGFAGAARTLLRPWNEDRSSLEARLRRRLARERGRADVTVRNDAAALARWCGLHAEGEEPVPVGLGLREIYRHLDVRSWRGLACLVIDDVQWARDEGDGLAIPEAYQLRWAEEGAERTLVVVSVRGADLEADPALRRRVEALVGRGAHRIDLPPLDRSGIEALLRETLTLAPELTERVSALCEGNPLFARQLLLDWAERGWLVDGGDLRFTLREGVDVTAALPRDATTLLRERLAALAERSGSPRRFLDAVHVAALAGRTLPQALLEAFVGSELWAYTRGCGLWVAKDDAIEFESGPLHQAVLAEAEARDDVHYLRRRLGRAWLRFGAASGEPVALEAGRHAAAAGDHELAVDALLEAVEAAWARGRTGQLDQATRWLLDAVEAAGAVDEREADACLWRGRALDALGDAAAAAEMFRRARNRAEERGRVDRLIESLIGLGWTELRRGDLEAAECLFSDAVGRARNASEVRLEALALAGKGWVEQQKRNFHGADVLFTRVLARCTQLSDLRGAGEALLGRAYVARRTGAFTDAEAFYDDAVEAFAEGGDPHGLARARLGLATVAREQQQGHRAGVILRDTVERTEELGATPLAMEARLGIAELARHAGEFDRAERNYLVHAAWAERAGVFEAGIVSALGLAQLALAREDLSSAYEQTSRAAELLERVPGHWLWASYRLVVATLLAKRRDHTSTWQWLWSAQELGLADTVDLDAASCLESICRVAVAEGWANVARVAAKLAVEQLAQLGLSTRAERVQREVSDLLSRA